MAQLLKRWESPRRQGRNDKGKGGSARKRQLRKAEKMLRQKLKNNNLDSDQQKTKNGGKTKTNLPLIFCLLLTGLNRHSNSPKIHQQQ